MYAKLIGSTLEQAPATLKRKDGSTVIGAYLSEQADALYREAGYLPVEPAAPPDALNHYNPIYVERDGKITVERWERVEVLSAEATQKMALGMFRAAVDAGTVTDEEIYHEASAIEGWDPSFRGNKGAVRQHKAKVYRSIINISTADHNREPGTAPTIWAEIPDPANEWPEWIPYAGTVLYQIGSKCSSVDYGAPADTTVYNWESSAANNVWKPGEYGWTKVGVH